MNSQERIMEKATNLHSHISPDGGTLKYDFMTSLQNMAKTKIMTTLWVNQMIRQTKKDSEIDLVPIVTQLPLPNSIIIKELIPIISHLHLKITEWINYCNQFLLNTKRRMQFRAINFINNIAWTARGKIDHAQTAKNILINQKDCLTDDQKYKIACNFCLEEQIAIFGAEIKNPNYLDSVDEEKNPMVYFWLMQIASDYSQFVHYRRVSGIYNSINEYVMELLINLCKTGKDFFEVPIRYVWNKLSEEEKVKNAVKIISSEVGNFTYSLLSDLNYEQQQEVFKTCSYKILQKITNDWSWEKYFLPTALHVLSIIDPKDFCDILYLVVRNAKKLYSKDSNLFCNKYKDIFKQLYKESSKSLRDYFIERSDFFLACLLSWKLDLDIIDLIFEDLDVHQKKNIILGSYGIRCCIEFIQKDKWYLLELFIKYTLSSQEDINLLKQRLKEEEGLEIALNFLEENALDKLDYFIDWVFNSAEDRDQFKQSLAHANYENILKSIIEENEVDFTDLENHFKWCAKEQPQAINQFKAEAPRYLIGKLLERSQFLFVDNILNWCFENQEQIVHFKSNMYKDDKLFPDIVSLIISSLGKQCPFTLLDGFVAWAFTNVQEMQEFKMWLLYPQKEKYSVCTDLLKIYQYSLADKFINWCGVSLEAVREFKNALMLSVKDMRHILCFRTSIGYPELYSDYSEPYSDYSEPYSEYELQKLIEWFNPSRETVERGRALLKPFGLPNTIFSKFHDVLTLYKTINFK